MVLCQISTHLINDGVDENSLQSQFYNKIWDSIDGYWKPEHYWEIPLWAARMSSILYANHEEHSFIVIDSIRTLSNATYAFSVLDVNKSIIKAIIKRSPDAKFLLGGYVDFSEFGQFPNVTCYDSLRAFCEARGLTYNDQARYDVFIGDRCIPRLTLSRGCRHQCLFCSIPKVIEERNYRDVFHDAVNIAHYLRFKYIYIDDKTYGQAKNHVWTHRLYGIIKTINPEFEGFIVQTTAKRACSMNFDFLKIAVVEIGVESVNDEILRKYKKPSSENAIEMCVNHIRQFDVKFIPNIIIGFPEENMRTYSKTFDWVVRNSDIITSMNIYNLAIYDEAPLSKLIEHDDEDKNELNQHKSFYSPEDADAIKQFSTSIFAKGIEILNKTKHTYDKAGV